mmetsp:Transcript_38486/g.90858  ORF Transcript_38486/g.90858 Transcript_38486/m.90858 type:complete len:304 (-) Transcript_38486:877-1788(-)
MGLVRAQPLRLEGARVHRHLRGLELERRALRRRALQLAAAVRPDRMDLFARACRLGLHHEDLVDLGLHATRGRQRQRQRPLRPGARAQGRVAEHRGGTEGDEQDHRARHSERDGGGLGFQGPRDQHGRRVWVPRRDDQPTVLYLLAPESQHAAHFRPEGPGQLHSAVGEVPSDGRQRRHAGVHVRGAAGFRAAVPGDAVRGDQRQHGEHEHGRDRSDRPLGPEAGARFRHCERQGAREADPACARHHVGAAQPLGQRHAAQVHPPGSEPGPVHSADEPDGGGQGGGAVQAGHDVRLGGVEHRH